MQTRDAIDGKNLIGTRNGRLSFKHCVSGFGTIATDDLERGILRMIDTRTKQEIRFADANELIAAGWVLD